MIKRLYVIDEQAIIFLFLMDQPNHHHVLLSVHEIIVVIHIE